MINDVAPACIVHKTGQVTKDHDLQLALFHLARGHMQHTSSISGRATLHNMVQLDTDSSTLFPADTGLNESVQQAHLSCTFWRQSLAHTGWSFAATQHRTHLERCCPHTHCSSVGLLCLQCCSPADWCFACAVPTHTSPAYSIHWHA